MVDTDKKILVTRRLAVDYVNVPPEAAKESMLGTGFSEWRTDGVGEYAKAYSEGYGDFTTDGAQTEKGPWR